MNEIIKQISENWKLDAKLEDGKYFFNYDEVNSILKGKKSYVIGRKGIGKTAICKHIENAKDFNSFATKLTFKSFPFNELYSLDDKKYTFPNQYITLWKYLIYLNVCKLMIDNESIKQEVRNKLEEIFPKKKLNMLAKDIREWTSTKFNISLLGFGLGGEGKKNVVEDNTNWIDKVSILEEVIQEYAGDANYYIVFDELDEDYHNVKEKEHLEYYIPLLTGLFKAVQNIKCTFNNGNINIYPVVFLRDDIYSQIRDSDKNKWNDLKVDLEWNENTLKNLIAYRISQDVNDGEHILSFEDAWNKIIKNNCKIHMGDEKKKILSPFEYILRSTQFRPRDLIKYITCCCKEAIDRKQNYINEDIILWADRAFSNYFIDEMIDEIYPVLPDIQNIFQIFSNIGKWNLKVTEFRSTYKKFLDAGTINEPNIDYVLENLFNFSIIGNQHASRKDIYYFKFKQTNMKLNKDKNIILHRGLFKALQIL